MTTHMDCLTKAKELVMEFYRQHPEIKASHGWEHIESVLDHTNRALLSLEDKQEEEGIICSTTTRTILPSKVKMEIQLAALLHDMDDKKYFPKSNYQYHNSTNTTRSDGIATAYPNANKILKAIGINPSSSSPSSLQKEVTNSHEQIIKMISWISCSTNGNNIPDEVKEHNSYHLLIPRWADRLTAVGSKGVIRCYQYNQECGRPLSSNVSPRPSNEKELWSNYATPCKLDDYIARGGSSTDMISHYYDKLLHIARPPRDIVRNAYLERQAESSCKELVEVCLRFGRTGQVDEEYIKQLMMDDEGR